MTVKIPQTEKGSVLVLSLLVSLLLLGVGLSTMWISSQQSHVSGNLSRRAEAYRAAMAGLERASSILGGEAIWDSVLAGCDTFTTDSDKGIVMCAGPTELVDQRVLPNNSVSDQQTRMSDQITYTVWVRNDDDEGGFNDAGVPFPDTDSRLIVRSEGRGRDGISFVALETVYTRSAAGGVQESNYSQARISSAGGNSAKAAIKD